MAEDKEYSVRPVEKKVETVEAIVDEENTAESQAASQPNAVSKKTFSTPAIPTDKIFKMVTDREMMKQAWKDETMEPHFHMVKLIILIIILAVIISLLGL
jgi:hypothetical protein